MTLALALALSGLLAQQDADHPAPAGPALVEVSCPDHYTPVAAVERTRPAASKPTASTCPGGQCPAPATRTTKSSRWRRWR
jgi:hypothetical protein